ncbi:MAG: TIGR00159 family protein [Chlorobi bacterium]|nr:TIGR00159 family protein [Chlorobiota bacterium]
MSLLFITLRFLDVVDIFLVAFLLYQLYRLIRGTVAMDIFAGIFLVYLFWLIVKALNMEMLASILGQVIGVGVIALIVVFQQEIRRFLLMIGNRYMKQPWFSSGIFSDSQSPMEQEVLDHIYHAVGNMSKNKTGALIVMARQSELAAVIKTGQNLDAVISSRLLESIFFKNNPLHDGAVVIRHHRIEAAGCVLPITENIFLPSKYGMRHRAALGLAEQNDAVTIIVSEETGEISLAYDAEIHFNLSLVKLKNEINILFG